MFVPKIGGQGGVAGLNVRRVLSNLIGGVGVVLLIAAIAGFALRATSSREEGIPARVGVATLGVSETGRVDRSSSAAIRTGLAKGGEVANRKRSSVLDGQTAVPYYPLEVGRYWVYRYEDAERGAISSRRYIERREYRNGRELFFFDDGTVAYEKAGLVYEMGDDGGVNVIPVGSETEEPYIYRSQGMQIEKRIGAIDTIVEVGGRSYENCLEVVTRFRAIEHTDRFLASYSSFYSRGIGLVGRQRLRQDGEATLSVTLEDYGIRQL